MAREAVRAKFARVAPGEIRAQKTPDLVAAQLRRLIVRGELVEGDFLPAEAVLLEQFNVSRPTLREAFRVLESEGLIEVRRGAHGGARVQSPSPSVAAHYAGLVLQHMGMTLGEVYEAQALIEAPLAGSLARTRTKEDIAALEAALAEGDPANDRELAELWQAQSDFHFLIPELAGNRVLAMMSGMLREILTAVTATLISDGPSDAANRRLVVRSHKTHSQYIGLVRDRDAKAAEDLWRRHVIEGSKEARADFGLSVVELLT